MPAEGEARSEAKGEAKGEADGEAQCRGTYEVFKAMLPFTKVSPPRKQQGIQISTESIVASVERLSLVINFRMLADDTSSRQRRLVAVSVEKQHAGSAIWP